jgi:hypothetical protein
MPWILPFGTPKTWIPFRFKASLLHKESARGRPFPRETYSCWRPKVIRLLLTACIFFQSVYTFASPSPVCDALEMKRIAEEAEADETTPGDLCRVMGGTNCSYSHSYGDAICRSYNGDNCSYTKNLGDGICRALKGTNCSYVTNLGDGICRAAGGDNCSYSKSLGEGICRGLKGDNCSYVKNLGDGICRGLKGSNCSSVTDAAQIRSWRLQLSKFCGQ